MTRLNEPFQHNLPAESDMDGWDTAKSLVLRMDALRMEADALSRRIDSPEHNDALDDAAGALENAAADICVAFGIDLGNVRASLAAAAE